ARLTYSSQDRETVARTAAKIARMERGLERLRLCSEMLSTEQGRRDDRLIRERNAFAKQYKRKWRPSRRPEHPESDGSAAAPVGVGQKIVARALRRRAHWCRRGQGRPTPHEVCSAHLRGALG